jgi:hypothetical protein
MLGFLSKQNYHQHELNHKLNNMKEKFVSSVTLVLVGNMLTTFNNIGNGWTSTSSAIIGFIIYFIGLGQLKFVFDEFGQKGVKLLINSTVVGLVALFFDFIPLMGILAGIIYIVAFIMQIVGLLELQKSNSIGSEGVGGVGNLIGAMVLVIIGSILGLIPFAGNTINALISLIALVVIIFGWLKIQRGMIANLGIVTEQSSSL